jgi:hypothetical protein
MHIDLCMRAQKQTYKLHVQQERKKQTGLCVCVSVREREREPAKPY